MVLSLLTMVIYRSIMLHLRSLCLGELKHASKLSQSYKMSCSDLLLVLVVYMFGSARLDEITDIMQSMTFFSELFILGASS